MAKVVLALSVELPTEVSNFSRPARTGKRGLELLDTDGGHRISSCNVEHLTDPRGRIAALGAAAVVPRQCSLNGQCVGEVLQPGRSAQQKDGTIQEQSQRNLEIRSSSSQHIWPKTFQTRSWRVPNNLTLASLMSEVIGGSIQAQLSTTFLRCTVVYVSVSATIDCLNPWCWRNQPHCTSVH